MPKVCQNASWFIGGLLPDCKWRPYAVFPMTEEVVLVSSSTESRREMNRCASNFADRILM